MPKKLTLIRHAAIDNTFDHCYIGRRDVPLSPAGHHQAARLAQHLQERNIVFDALWCSPALRARQTTTALLQTQPRHYLVRDELQEVHFGRWEGLTFAQICAQDPQQVNAWATQQESFCFPDGEAQRDFIQRVATMATAICSTAEDHLAIVSHGGVIRSLICRLVGWPTDATMKFTIERGGYATLDLYDQQAVLTGLYNDL